MFRVRTTVWIAILTIIAALLAGSCSGDSPRVNTTEGLKKALSEPDPGSILVLSIPSKLKIYFGQDTDTKETVKSKWVPMKKSHPLIDEKNLKGETPLLLQDMKPGNYLLGISPIIVLDRNFKWGEIDATLTVKSFVVFGGVPSSYPPPKKDSKGAAIYSITKKENTPLRVIVLAYPEGASLEELKARYPADDLFEFYEQGFLDDLKKQTSTLLSESQSKDIVSLLRRGGKIAVTFGDIKIVGQINTDQTWELKTFAQIKKKSHETGDDSLESPVKVDVKGKVIPGTPGSGKSLDSKTPIRVASGKKPRLIKRVKPRYPEIAKKARIQGKVILDASVDIYGRVIPGSIKVLSGHPLLRQAAVDAAKQWVYDAYIQEGARKPVRFNLVVDFNLKK